MEEDNFQQPHPRSIVYSFDPCPQFDIDEVINSLGTVNAINIAPSQHNVTCEFILKLEPIVQWFRKLEVSQMKTKSYLWHPSCALASSSSFLDLIPLQYKWHLGRIIILIPLRVCYLRYIKCHYFLLEHSYFIQLTLLPYFWLSPVGHFLFNALFVGKRPNPLGYEYFLISASSTSVFRLSIVLCTFDPPWNCWIFSGITVSTKFCIEFYSSPLVCFGARFRLLLDGEAVSKFLNHCMFTWFGTMFYFKQFSRADEESLKGTLRLFDEAKNGQDNIFVKLKSIILNSMDDPNPFNLGSQSMMTVSLGKKKRRSYAIKRQGQFFVDFKHKPFDKRKQTIAQVAKGYMARKYVRCLLHTTLGESMIKQIRKNSVDDSVWGEWPFEFNSPESSQIIMFQEFGRLEDLQFSDFELPPLAFEDLPADLDLNSVSMDHLVRYAEHLETQISTASKALQEELAIKDDITFGIYMKNKLIKNLVAKHVKSN